MTKIITNILIALSVSVNAQFVIDSTVYSKQLVKLTISSVTDTNSLINPSSGGANKMWDFSTIVPTNALQTQAMNFLPTSSNTLFPAANILLKGAAEMYYGISATEFSFYGMEYYYNLATYKGHSITTMKPKQIIYKFPLTYNSSYSSSNIQQNILTYSPAIPSEPDSTKNIMHRTYGYLVDGWGTVITPYGTYTCLRMKSAETNIDTTFIHKSTGAWVFSDASKLHTDSVYSWFTKDFVEVVRIAPTTYNQKKYYEYTFTKPTVAAGLTDVNSVTKFTIYPNPTINQLTISSSEKLISAAIYNIQGEAQIYETANFIDVSALSAGIYFINVKTQEGNTIQKFIKE